MQMQFLTGHECHYNNHKILLRLCCHSHNKMLSFLNSRMCPLRRTYLIRWIQRHSFKHGTNKSLHYSHLILHPTLLVYCLRLSSNVNEAWIYIGTFIYTSIILEKSVYIWSLMAMWFNDLRVILKRPNS